MATMYQAAWGSHCSTVRRCRLRAADEVAVHPLPALLAPRVLSASVLAPMFLAMSITLAQAIKNAIVAEQSAEKFYLRLAAGCADEEGRRLLSRIAAQEHNHAA